MTTRKPRYGELLRPSRWLLPTIPRMRPSCPCHLSAVSMRPVRTTFLFLLCSLLCACGPDLLIRADQPLSLADVQRRAKTNFPFPASAHHIHYAIFRDRQAAEYLIRFDAPPSDCEATVSRALAWHQASLRSTATYQPQPFAGLLPSASWLRPVAWFDGATIQRGIYAGEDSSHAPNVWVDLDGGHFYYRSDD
jgi:hypothetical protein